MHTYVVSECLKMIGAFGKQNKETDYKWKDIYSDGFDVYDFSPLVVHQEVQENHELI